MFLSPAATSSSVESGAASAHTRRRYGWLIDANCSASVSIETSPMLPAVGCGGCACATLSIHTLTSMLRRREQRAAMFLSYLPGSFAQRFSMG